MSEEKKKYAQRLVNSVSGASVKTNLSGIVFTFSPEVIDELKQLQFNIDVLKLQGGETTLPELAEHIDAQASLESNWGARAEKARYQYSCASEDFDYWYNKKYGEINTLFVSEKRKCTQKDIEAEIIRTHGIIYKKKRDKKLKLEYRYRMLSNACYAAILTKGRMMQSLRNIVQGTFDGSIPNIQTKTGGGIKV